MRICDVCKKVIPIGNSDRIEIQFNGKFGKFIKKIHGDDILDFCSFTCFNQFKLPEYAEAKEIET